MVNESNDELDEVKRKIETIRNSSEEMAFDFCTKLTEIFEDNISAKKTVRFLKKALIILFRLTS